MGMIRFSVKFAPDTQKRWFIEKGRAAYEWEESVSSNRLTAEERAHLLVMARSQQQDALNPFDPPKPPITQVYATEYRADPSAARIRRTAYGVSLANPDDAEVISLIFDRADWVAIIRAVIAADRRRYEAALEELKRADAEMREWIEKFGSDYLRLLVSQNYPFWAKYVEERCAKEFPEFVPDVDGRARWRKLEHADDPPTPEQLTLADRYGGKCVRLTQSVSECADDRTCVIIERAFGGVALIERDA